MVGFLVGRFVVATPIAAEGPNQNKRVDIGVGRCIAVVCVIGCLFGQRLAMLLFRNGILLIGVDLTR